MPTPRNPHARMDLWRAKDDGSLYRGEDCARRYPQEGTMPVNEQAPVAGLDVPRYSHRNGETEPPTEGGEFWFNGQGSYEKNTSDTVYKISDRVRVSTDSSGTFVLCRDGKDRSHLFEIALMDGKWYGPSDIPPWETAPAQPHSAGVPEPLIVDEPDEFGVIRIWPFGREPFLASVDVITNFFERDGSISGTKIRYGGYPTSVDGTRRYAQALLKACEIAEQQRPGSD